MLLGQSNGIIVGMRNLVGVGEWCGTFLRSQAQPACESSKGERAVVLCTAAHDPVAVADTLKQRVGIIIGCDALLFRVAGLGGPAVLAVG